MSINTNNPITFWMKANNSFLLFYFENDSNDKNEFLKEVSSLYNEWMDPDSADIDPELMGEIDNSSPEDWILEHLCDCSFTKVEMITYSNETAVIIDHIMDTIEELDGYSVDSEYDHLEQHDCSVISDSLKSIINYTIKNGSENRRIIVEDDFTN